MGRLKNWLKDWLKDWRLARKAGKLERRRLAAEYRRLQELGEGADVDWDRLAELAENSMKEPEQKRRPLAWLGWLADYGRAAAVLLLLVTAGTYMTSWATALALGEQKAGCAMPERAVDTLGLQEALVGAGIDRQLVPWFLPGEEGYEEQEVWVCEEGAERVFVGQYLERGPAEYWQEANRLPLTIIVRQHLNVQEYVGEIYQKEPDFGPELLGEEPRRLDYLGISYWLGESRGRHWLYWRQSEFEVAIVGYFSEAAAEQLVYQMQNQRNADRGIGEE